MVDFEMLSREARSFVGLQPPFQAKEVCKRYIGNEIYAKVEKEKILLI